MALFAALRYRFRALFRADEVERELKEEIEFHLSLEAMQQEGNAADDALRGDAPYAARRRFGNVTHYAEETRAMSRLGFFDMARQDIRFALRTFRHAPGFTAVAGLTIALGLGATTAIFSVVNALILQPLPYPDAERIVAVWMDNRKLGVREDFHSYPNLADLKSQNQVLSHLAPYNAVGFNLTGSGEPQRIIAGALPAEAFDALGVKPILGRLFTAENETTGSDGVVVLSYGLWQADYSGDPAVIGKQIELNGRKRTVVGVMPKSFAFPSEQSRLWVPLVIPDGLKTARSAYAYPAIGRLKPGVSLARARADLSAIGKRLEQEYPFNHDYGVFVNPLPEQVVGPTLRTTLWIMLGAVAAVLLIACANVANLLLSRAAVREREVTVRMALGASGGRLIRQLLTESVLLSLIGGVAGVFLAAGGLRVLKAVAPSDLPRMDGVGVNTTVLIVTSFVTLFTGMIFGLVPAMQSSRTRLSETLRDGGRGGTSGRAGQRLRRTIVAAQLALVVVLLTGAGLLIRTFVSLQGTSLGFETRGVLTLSVQLPRAKYNDNRQTTALYQSFLDRVRAIQGVVSAGTVTTMMLTTTPNSGGIAAEGRAPRDQDPEVTFDAASPEFFKTVGARLVAGRYFTAADRDSAPPVAIINEHMAKYYWPGVSAIGKRVNFGGANADTTQSPWTTVVGVLADMRRTGVDMPVRNELFVPFAQSPSAGNLVVIKAARDPMSLVPSVRAAMRALDPTQPLSNIRTMDEMLSRLVAQRRFSATLVASFAALALVLATIGVYGVTSYLVTQRTKEIGVRLALGADPRAVTRLVVFDGMKIGVLGLVIGIVGALSTTRLASSLLYGVSPRDPSTVVGVSTFLLLVVAFANYLPARRAARVDPLVALRQD
jgi:putative ABC transport system permease protein